MSLVEAVANVAVGYGVAVASQVLVFPLFVLEIALHLAAAKVFPDAEEGRFGVAAGLARSPSSTTKRGNDM